MNTAVTVFKRIENTAARAFEWEKTVYSARVVSCERLSEATGDAAMQKNRLVVRIFGGEPIVNTGDMIVVGETEARTPPAEASVVISVRSNNRGSRFIRHTKIIAEG